MESMISHLRILPFVNYLGRRMEVPRRRVLGVIYYLCSSSCVCVRVCMSVLAFECLDLSAIPF